MVCNYAYIHYSVLEMKRNGEMESFRRLSCKRGTLTLQERKDMNRAREFSQLWEESQANCWRDNADAASLALHSLHALLKAEGMNFLSDDEDRVYEERKEGVQKINWSVAYKTPTHIRAQVLFDFIDQKKTRYLTESDIHHFLLAFGVTSEASSAFFQRLSLDKGKRLSFEEFKDNFSAFYEYAFNGLLEWTRIANAATDRNYLDHMVRKERDLKCPFRRVSTNPVAENRSRFSVFKKGEPVVSTQDSIKSEEYVVFLSTDGADDFVDV